MSAGRDSYDPLVGQQESGGGCSPWKIVAAVAGALGIAGLVGLAVHLATGSGTAANCVGFDECPQYPMPYEFGTWPETYDVAGSFPEGFVWGLGTAAYQIEGAYREDGRGASIWDTFSGADTVGMPGANCSYCCKQAPCPVNPAMKAKGATGNVADDHYHTFRDDIALMKSMNLKHYRFSLSWPRIVPTGRVSDGINTKAIDFYNNLIDGLLAEGITPYITLYHWDLPQGLLDPPRMMGWWSRDNTTGKPDGQILQDWKDYCDLAFEKFGDRVKWWMTFNEAWTFTFLASGWGKAPSIPELSNMTIDPWIAGHNILNAHAAAVDIYRKKYKATQMGQIGITNNCDWREPKTTDPADVAAAERAVEFWLGWFADPIYGEFGDYPPAMRALYGEFLPEFSEEQKALLQGSADFFGLNHYGTSWAAYAEGKPGGDRSFAVTTHEGFVQAMSGWLFGAGWGLRKLLNWVHRRYPSYPIYLTEGGWSLKADDSSDAAADTGRVLYYANYTSEVYKAIKEDDVDVRGYFAWSLMDNFEWEMGYAERFGSTYNDFEFGLDSQSPVDQTNQPTAGKQFRRRKQSSCWLEGLFVTNQLVDPSSNNFHGCVYSKEFTGSYLDKDSPDCKPTVTVEDDGRTGSVVIGNAEGKSCNKKGTYSAMFRGGTIVTTMSALLTAPRSTGYWNNHTGAINWGGGNTWTKMVV